MTEVHKVYIAGPYTEGIWEYNIRDVVNEAEKVRQAGHAPFVPHTMTTLWALVHPNEKDAWLDLDLEWLDACDCLIRLDGDSDGADREVAYARDHGIEVYESAVEMIDDVGRVTDNHA